jgi:AraC family transcriptional regulator
MIPRLFIEPPFSVELRSLRGAGVPAGSEYRILHLLSSRHVEWPEGTSLLLNPNQSFTFPSKTNRAEALLVGLSPEWLIETATRLRLYRTGVELQFRQPLLPLADSRLQSILNTTAQELNAADAGWREMVRSCIQQLTVYLLRAHINVRRSDEIELSRAGMVDRRLRRAAEFMHDNCGRELKLAEIAAAAYLSEYHFARLFKKLMGVTPLGFLAGLRIERARRLLAETDRSIVEIGAEVGYPSQSHFTKVFREATGLTPKAFRDAAR